ncbi:hypothetical protein [Verrucosispora sp. TAA-831]
MQRPGQRDRVLLGHVMAGLDRVPAQVVGPPTPHGCGEWSGRFGTLPDCP